MNNNPSKASRKRLRMKQAARLSTNNPHLIRILRTHPEILIHIRDKHDSENIDVSNNIEIDDLYTPAILKFQEAKGLKRDGIIGPKTWRAMGYDLSDFNNLANECITGGLEGDPPTPPRRSHRRRRGLEGNVTIAPRVRPQDIGRGGGGGRGLEGDPIIGGPEARLRPQNRGGLDGEPTTGPNL